MPTFQTKDFLSIVAGMINVLRASQSQLTDFNVGSVARSMLEAPAAELDALYQQMLQGLTDAIPVAIYNSFDFTALPAIPASGLVRVTITIQGDPVTIAADTRFTRTDTGAAYVAVESKTIAAGDTYADVRIVAELAGAAGNVVASTAFTPSPAPAGYVSALALADFITGADAETDAERKNRFLGYIASLARGTLAALDYGLTLVTLTDVDGNVTERVALSAIVEPFLTDPGEPPGLVNIYVHNGVGSTSADLVAEAVKVMAGYTEPDGTKVPGWKAAGVKLVIAAASESVQAVTAVVTIAAGFTGATVRAAVQDALASYILQRPIGANLYRAELVAVAMAVDGVENFSLTLPAADVTPTVGQKVMPGTFTLT